MGRVRFIQCDGCGALFKSDRVFERFSVNHDLDHGDTIERKVYEYCPDCQLKIKALLNSLGKKE